MTTTKTMTTKRPTGFFTLQAFTALSSTALFGMSGFLAGQSVVEAEEQSALREQQSALVSAAVEARVAEITAQQQAQVDAALAKVATLQEEYQSALDGAQQVSSSPATRATVTPLAVAPAADAAPSSSPAPSPSPPPTPAPAPAPAPAPVDGNSGGS